MSPKEAAGFLLAFVAVVIVVVPVMFRFIPLGLWIVAKSAGVEGVSMRRLFQMRLRRIPQDRIVLPLIAAVKSGMPITIDMLETHFVAGGNVDRVAVALIAARRAAIPLTLADACAMDLSGQDPAEFIKSQVRQGNSPLSTLEADAPMMRSKLKS
jgi:uncharacterized protein YqfA (UPF0365 family)